MKELAELKDIMAELLDGEIQCELEMAVTERGKEIINEIADYAETTELFRKSIIAAICFKERPSARCFSICLTAFAMRRPSFMCLPASSSSCRLSGMP